MTRAGAIRPETRRAHRARWFVYAGGPGRPLTKIPHQATMRGHWPGYDVACSCGWESKTAGATRHRVADALRDHRYEAQRAADRQPARITGADGTRVWVGETDTCAHCLLDIRRTRDGFDLPNGDPSFTWSAPVHDPERIGTIECPRELVGWADRLHEPIGSVFPPDK